MVRGKARQAGVAYLLGGVSVILFTFVSGLVPQNRSAEIFLLFPGIVFVGLFALIVYLGPAAPSPTDRPRRHGPRSAAVAAVTVARRWAPRVLAATNAGRAVLFLANATGQNVHVVMSPPRLFVVPSPPEPLFLVNLALAASIAFMLARAGWDLPPGRGERMRGR